MIGQGQRYDYYPENAKENQKNKNKCVTDQPTARPTNQPANGPTKGILAIMEQVKTKVGAFSGGTFSRNGTSVRNYKKMVDEKTEEKKNRNVNGKGK